MVDDGSYLTSLGIMDTLNMFSLYEAHMLIRCWMTAVYLTTGLMWWSIQMKPFVDGGWASRHLYVYIYIYMYLALLDGRRGP